MLITKRLSYFAKVILTAIASTILIFFAQSAFAQGETQIALFLFIATAAIIITYLTRVSIPLKFFLPGMLFLFAFVLGPVIYTISMSTFQYQTGNYISKPQSIERLLELGVISDENAPSFDVVLGKTSTGKLAILASNSQIKRYFVSTKDEITDLAPSELTLDENGVAQSAPNFTVLNAADRSKLDKEIASTRFKYQGDFFIKLEGLSAGLINQQSLFYDSVSDTFKNKLTGATYKDNGRGNYANIDNPSEILQPGWRSPIWFAHYKNLVTDPTIRKPLFKVFVWTFTFAFLTVLTQFALGLLVALTLNKPFFGRRFYRSIFILPYAMPSIMSILIWGGMFDTEFGAINNLFGTNIAWFQNATFARAAVIVVNLWLGFPYFYLVTSGALQAIPSELAEAAAIDGAKPRQIFSRVTLPLLLQIVSPLLVASFAFNFNNFNLIYLLTGGGPTNLLDGEIAGATDILISYTYKIAFGTNIQNLGLASAISVIIFLIVASISLYGIRRSKVLDSFK